MEANRTTSSASSASSGGFGVLSRNTPRPASDAFTVDLDDEEQVTRAVRRAVADALRTHKEKGWYVVGWENGQIVRVEPEDIVVPDVPDAPEAKASKENA